MHQMKNYILSGPKISMESCVGVHGEFPLRFGNYCTLATGQYLANMWSENLAEAHKQFTHSDPLLRFCEYQHAGNRWVILVDARVPREWRNDELCFTGTYQPPREIITDMYVELGVRQDALCRLRYLNPELYWKSRGGKYEKGVISLIVGAKQIVPDGYTEELY